MWRCAGTGQPTGRLLKNWGLTKNRLVRWYLETMGKTIGIRPGGYHSKENVHKRFGVYFDVTSLIEEEDSECSN